MSDSTPDNTPATAPPEKAQPTTVPSGIHLSKPLDEMSMASVAIVADAAAVIAQKKMEAAATKMAAAQAAMDRLAALKAGKPAPLQQAPTPVEPPRPAKPVELPKPPAAASIPVQRPVEPAPKPTPAVAIEAAKPVEAPSPAPKTPAEPIATRTPVFDDKAAPTPEAAATEAKAAPLAGLSNSGFIRLGKALRAEQTALTPKRPEPTGKRSLDPIANHSGLSRPSLAKPRKIVTPGLIFLFALMAFYGLYASGNLPQFDQWTDSVVNNAHAHNDQVVGGILGSLKYILGGIAACVVLLIAFLINNSYRQRHNAEHERDFHTR